VADVPILVCACGKRMKAPGAAPGRVGKCPACGARIRVPDASAELPRTAPIDEAESEPTGGYDLGPAPEVLKPSAYIATPIPSEPRLPTTQREGLIRPPERLESRLRDSLLYPLWGPTGLALLTFMPPVLWIASVPALGVLAILFSGSASIVVAVIGLLPSALLFLPVMSYTLLYLGRVLVTSAIGEVYHPRWPDWDIEEMLRGVGRWIWALLIGGVIGALPAVSYWMSCGDIDLFDGVILAELLAIGAVYGQMALLATILHDDPLAANPITVLRSLWQVGWGCLTPSLFGGTAALLAAFAIGGVLQIENPALSALAFWFFWVFVLYEAMVVLRVLGLFYHRRAAALGWFRDRPRWGA
jgi:hypothetical protein